jgi:hypothetical protein
VENNEGNLQHPLSVFRAQHELPGVKIEKKKREWKKRQKHHPII